MTTPAEPNPRRSRLGLYVPLGLFLAAFAAWSLYWFYAAHQIETRLTAERSALIEAGWRIDHSPLKVGGYPYRLHVALTDVELRSPGGQGLSLPTLDAEANAWSVFKWVFVLPDTLTWHRGSKNGAELGTVAITGKGLTASLSGLDKPVPRFAVEGQTLSFTPSDTARPYALTRLARFEAYTRPSGSEDTVDMLVRLTDAEGAPNSTIARLGAGKPVSLHLEGQVHAVKAFAGADLQRAAQSWATARGQVTDVKASINAGEATVFATSQALGLDSGRALTGYVDIAISGKGKPFDIFEALGLISFEDYPQAKALTRLEVDTKGEMKVTLGFHDGGVYLGPLAVSNAPILP